MVDWSQPYKSNAAQSNGSTMFDDYEQISDLNPTNAVAVADHIIQNGWRIDNSPVISLVEPVTWTFGAAQDRSWNFKLHAWDGVDPLLMAHSQTLEPHYLEIALRHAVDWIEQPECSPDDDTQQSMSWYDMAVGLRSYRLAYVFQIATRNGLLDAATQQQFIDMLERHRGYLVDDANIMFHNNHGYYQVAGQIAMARRFLHDWPEMAACYDQGKERLSRMINQQFAHDGSHLEHSPDYHRMVLRTLRGLIKSGLVDEPADIQKSLRAEDALAWLVRPDGYGVNFGDSDDRKMVVSAKAAMQMWDSPLLQSVTGAHGLPRPEGMKVFDDGGYAIVRTPCLDAPSDPRQDSYLAQMAGFHSRTHKHADNLSFILHDFGVPILIDSGRYGYIGKTQMGSALWEDGFWYDDPMRVYMESTRAHNTLSFDDLNHPRRKAEFYGNAVQNVATTAGIYAVETQCKLYRTTKHTRVLIYKPRHFLIVFDHFSNGLKEPHEVKQWFHLAPGLTPLCEENTYTVQEFAQYKNLHIAPLLGGVVASEVMTGQRHPILQGWFSPDTQRVVPVSSFHYAQAHLAPTGVFATLFNFNGVAKPNMVFSKSNVTGRRAQFKWIDERGQHRIFLSRETGLTVDYAAR